VIDLIIASKNNALIDHWPDTLEPKYSISLSKNIDAIFADSLQYEKNVELVVDALLISQP
jgi:hypothetical protein